MIARTWRCLASHENVAHYIEHFEQSVFPELRTLKGFSEAFILRRPDGEAVELTVMTLWDSLEAIRAFAGENAEVAVVAPAAESVLISFDSTVTHYDVILNSR